MSKYLKFVVTGISASRKTYIISVQSKDDTNLGTISWFAPWRQYTFNPGSSSTFNAECLKDIADELKRMNVGHKRMLAKRKDKEGME